MKRENIKLVAEAITLYAIGEYSDRPMDELTLNVTSDSEWDFVCSLFDLVDEIMVDHGKGTVQQTEKVLAKRENRADRNASVFDNKHKRMEVAYTLADEFTKRGIKFEAAR